MSEFSDNVTEDTPRLVVRFQRDVRGLERFDWTVIGGVPTLSVIGAILHAQSQILTRDPYLGRCADSMLVIAWDEASKEFHYFVDPAIPQEPLAGYLDLVKDAVKGSLMQKSIPKPTLLGPDGRPMRSDFYKPSPDNGV